MGMQKRMSCEHRAEDGAMQNKLRETQVTARNCQKLEEAKKMLPPKAGVGGRGTPLTLSDSAHQSCDRINLSF